jgi:hypothetical protein
MSQDSVPRFYERRHNQREAFRSLDPLVYSVEPFLRDIAMPGGIFRASPDLIARDCGRHRRKRVIRVLEELCALKNECENAYLVYSFDLFVGYFPGWANVSSPDSVNSAAYRRRRAEALPDCPERQMMLEELKPYETLFASKQGKERA